MSNSGRIDFEIGLSNSQLQRDAQRSRAILQGVGDTARQEGAAIDETFRNIGKTIAGAFTVQKATEFIQRVITTRKEIQALELSFTALLGSKEKADKLFGNLKQFAATTTFSISDLAKGAQTLLGFNVAAEKVETILHAIGDISMGDMQKFQSLTLAFSQMSSTGKLMGQDLLQMINAGFNPLATISEKTGKSIGELKDEMSKGTLSAEMITQAFIDATSEGGKFYNMLAVQSEGIAGSMAKLSGTIQDAFNNIGEQSEGIITGGIQMLQVLAENYEKIGRVIAELVATYGVYKATLMTLNAVEALRYQATLAHMAGLTKMGAVMEVLKAKTAALNSVIMKNPYVLVAAGVAAFATAVYKLATYQTDAEKATKKLNDATKEMNSSLAAERAKVDILFARLKAAKEGTEEYKAAKTAIISQYGEYLKGLSDEAKNLTDISAAYAAITEEATKAAKARAMASFTETAATDYGKVEAGARSDLHRALERKYGGQTDSDGVTLAEVYFQKLIPVLEGKTKADEELTKVINSFDAEAYSGGGSFGGGTSFTYNEVEGILDKVQKARDVMNNTMKEARIRFGDVETKAAKAETPKTVSSSLPEDSGTDKIAGEIAQRTAKIAEYSKKVSAAVAQAELEIRQADINAMEDSYEKSKAQINLNYDRLILENEKRREEMIEALKDNMTNEWMNANPNATKEQELNYRASLNVGTEDLSKGQQDALAGYDIAAAREYSQALEELDKKRLENERASILAYIKEYGEYEEKRVALKQEAEDKIAKIRANGNITDTDKDYQIKGIEKGLEEALKDLDFEKLKKDMDWETIFSDIDNLPLDVLNVAKEQLEEFKASMTDLSPEQIKTVTEALAQLKDKMDMQQPIQSIKNAAAAYKKAKKEFSDATKEYKKARAAGDTKGMEAANKKMIKSSKTMAEAAETEKQAYAELSEVTDSFVSVLKEAGDAIGGTVGEMLSFSATALSCGNAMAAGVLAFKDACSTLEKSVAILAVISAALQLIQGIVSLFGGKEDTTLKDYVSAMDTYIKLLDDSISDLNDAMMDTKNTIAETLEVYKELVGLEEKQAEAIKRQNRVWLNSGASSGSHSEGYKIAKTITDGMKSSDKTTAAFYWSAFNKLDQYKRKATHGKEGAYTTGLGRLDWIWDLSDDDLRAIAKDPELLAALGDEVSGKLVDYVESLDAKEALQDALNEAILGVSWDNFYDGFVDMISDMDVTSEEFADNFTEYMRNALIKQMVNSEFKDRLEKIYKQAAEYMQAGTLEDHIDELKDDWTKTGEEARKRVELINQITGYETEASREASQKGIATASQESVDENNARLTTIQGHTYMLAQSSGENRVYLMAASEHLKAIREIASTGLQHLSDISRNTYQLYETNQRLKRVEEDLSGINTKGVIIRSV